VRSVFVGEDGGEELGVDAAAADDADGLAALFLRLSECGGNGDGSGSFSDELVAEGEAFDGGSGVSFGDEGRFVDDLTEEGIHLVDDEGVEAPSQMVGFQSIQTGPPLRKASARAGFTSDCTPTMRMSGLRALRTLPMPQTRAPPPTGTKTVSTSGRSAKISRPMVPWPAIMAGSPQGFR
jgi:hypothetical protein